MSILFHRPCAAFCSAVRLLSVLFVALNLLTTNVLADGPSDNQSENVRPIPPPGIEIQSSELHSLSAGCQQLRDRWADVLANAVKATQDGSKWQRQRSQQRLTDLRALECEILVFPRAVEMAIELNQFYKEEDVQAARELLSLAQQRIDRAVDDASWPTVVGLATGTGPRQLLVGGFQSDLDGSYQPYAVVVPAGYAAHDARPRRLDLWFHGRGEKLSELAFLTNGQRSAGQYTPADSFVLHPYGRYSNAFKFAGEIDVLEVLEYVSSKLPVDESRISARGFSMGGAACWQIATHYSDRFFAANPGAGFSETPLFLKSFQGEDLSGTPEYQVKLWRWYDNPFWARNLINCPTVAYSGEIDRQKQAADVMQSVLAKEGIALTHIIGPQTGHKIHADSKVEIEARMASLAANASSHVPLRVELATQMLRYHRMHWLDVQGLEQHWETARVVGQLNWDQAQPRVAVRTENVSHLNLSFAAGEWLGDYPAQPIIEIDGDQVAGPTVNSDRSFNIQLVKSSRGWVIAEDSQVIRKRPGLQGPIDDAFMSSFLFVLPEAHDASGSLGQWIQQEAEHAQVHWRKHYRGDVRAVKASELTEQHIADHNLILFGTPETNAIIKDVVKRLPVQWDADGVQVGKQQFAGSDNALVMISPNPANPERYVVLNSGFTFREYDYLNNARQTPKLPDWAVIDTRQPITSRGPSGVLDAGFFDEAWQPR